MQEEVQCCRCEVLHTSTGQEKIIIKKMKNQKMKKKGNTAVPGGGGSGGGGIDETGKRPPCVGWRGAWIHC
jgi:hypothetical protein